MRTDLNIFVLYRITSRMYFHLPVLFLLLYISEIDLYNIIVLLAVYGMTTIISANLSTYLMRYMRLKVIVALGESLKAVGLLLIIMGTRVGNIDFFPILLGQIVGGCGFSLALSTDSNLLKTLAVGFPANTFGDIQARSQSLMFIATLFAGFLGGLLFAYEAHWPFYASFFVALIAALMILNIKEEFVPITSGSTNSQSREALILDKDQLFWMRFYSLSRTFTLGPFIGFLTFYFIMIQVDTYLFGVVLGLFTLSGFVSAFYSGKFLKHFSMRALIICMISCMFGSMLLFGMSDTLSDIGIDYFPVGLLALTLIGLGSGGVRPIAMGNIDMSKLSQQQRTMVLSAMERNFGIYNGILLLVGGVLLIQFGFQSLMLILAVVYLLTMGGLVAYNQSGSAAVTKTAPP